MKALWLEIVLIIIGSVAVDCTRAYSQGVTQYKTNVTESTKNGRLKRIKEVFSGNVLVHREVETDSDGDGQIDLRVVKIFTDKQLVYASTWDARDKKSVRSFLHDGKTLVVEADEDFDGFFETIAILGPSTISNSGRDGFIMAAVRGY